jgi:hypothetical protein
MVLGRSVIWPVLAGIACCSGQDSSARSTPANLRTDPLLGLWVGMRQTQPSALYFAKDSLFAFDLEHQGFLIFHGPYTQRPNMLANIIVQGDGWPSLMRTTLSADRNALNIDIQEIGGATSMSLSYFGPDLPLAWQSTPAKRSVLRARDELLDQLVGFWVGDQLASVSPPFLRITRDSIQLLPEQGDSFDVWSVYGNSLVLIVGKRSAARVVLQGRRLTLETEIGQASYSYSRTAAPPGVGRE